VTGAAKTPPAAKAGAPRTLTAVNGWLPSAPEDDAVARSAVPRFSLFPDAKTDPELAPFRPGLVFAFFNALAWQIGIGTPMVLFAEQLGATAFQVGLAYSFAFILTPIQIVATALLPRFGFKAVMLGGWGTRSFFLAVPAALAAIALARGGERPWMVGALIASVFFFCLFRSIGASASISWFYAILPPSARGRYFASDQFFGGLGGIGTLLVSVALFAVLPVYWALLAQYIIALVGSTISYFALRQMPDAPRPTALGLATVARDTPRQLFAPSVFRRYVPLAIAFAVLSTPIPPFAAYYLKVGPRLGMGQIMVFEVFRYTGVMTAAWLIRRRIDVTGAKPFFLLALGLNALVAVAWWVCLETAFVQAAVLCAMYFVVGLGATSWAIANLNYLPKILPEAERTLGVAIHGAVTAFLGGMSPIVWGAFLKTGEGAARAINLPVFAWFFVFVAVTALVLSSFVARLPEDKSHPVEPLLIGNALLRPLQAMTYLANLIDVRPSPRSGDGRSSKHQDPSSRE
jgi:MFS family permease